MDDISILITIIQAIWLQLPFSRTAHQLVGSSNAKQTYYELDSYFHAMVSNDVTRRASINQGTYIAVLFYNLNVVIGKCFLRAVKDTFPFISDQLDYYLNPSPEVRLSSSYHTHFAPLFGLTCGMLKISLPLCDRMFLRMLMRDIVSSATRLSIIGPMKGSHLQASLSSVIENLLVENNKAAEISADTDDATLHDTNELKFYKNLVPVVTMPILEFVQSRHDLMYTRLFNT